LRVGRSAASVGTAFSHDPPNDKPARGAVQTSLSRVLGIEKVRTIRAARKAPNRVLEVRFRPRGLENRDFLTKFGLRLQL
jgi:hypothetical protein